MQLQYLVNLSREQVHDVELAAVSSDIDTASFLLAFKLAATAWIIEQFAAGCIIQWHQLRGQKVIFNFENPDVFFTTTHQGLSSLNKLQWNQFKVSELSTQQLYPLLD
mgnify:CR=1 FL=1